MHDPRKVFRKVEVIPDWVRGHFVQWQLDPFFRGAQPYNFALEISKSGNFSEIAAVKDNLGDVFFAVDDTKIKQSWAPNYSYRIRLTTANGKNHYSQAILFGSTRHDSRKYAMAAEIARKEILLARYAGTEGWLLRRKSYGTKSATAARNVDPVSGVPIADTKHEDYGVGVEGGYFSPVPCVFYIENSTQDKQLDVHGLGVKESYVSQVRMPGYPIIEVRDIICEARDGYRYSVQARNAKQFPGTNITLTQRATFNLIPNTDSAYSIPIPIPI
jgi:hypothetical protein